jgi:preprotein translocase subunit SecE
MIKKIRTFFKEVRSELKKVSWPKKDELIRSTSVVIIMILLTAVIVGVLDYIFYTLILASLGVQ